MWRRAAAVVAAVPYPPLTAAGAPLLGPCVGPQLFHPGA
eukprot:gene17814-60959_t